MHALKHPVYAERYSATRSGSGKQRGARVAQTDIARRLANTIWHMLTRNQNFAPQQAPLFVCRHRPTRMDLRPRANHPISPDPPVEEAIAEVRL